MKTILLKRLFLGLLFLVATKSYSQRIMEEFNPIVQGYPLMRTMEVQADGKIYLGGDDISFVGDYPTNGLVRLNPDLTLDKTFVSEVAGSNTIVFKDISASDDSVILVLASSELFVLKKDGSIDDSFTLDNSIRYVDGCKVVGDKYLVSAYIDDAQRVIMLNRDGSIDHSFKQNSILFSTIELTVKIQPDRKILLAGVIQINGMDVPGVARLNPDGTVDESFNAIGSADGDIKDIAIQEDGKIIVVGEFNEFSNTKSPGGIVRLAKDGSIDPEFTLGTTAKAATWGLYGVEVLNDNKIVVVGRTYNGGNSQRLLRLNSNGTLDLSFPSISMPQYNFYNNLEIMLSPASDIMVLGGFAQINGVERLGFASFSTDGIILEKNAKLAGKADIRALAIQRDGKIVIGGKFNKVNGKEAYNLARLLPDGSIDNEFSVDLDLSDPRGITINALAIQEDGKILVGGQVTADLLRKAGIFRIMQNGAFDSTLQINTIAGHWGVSEIFVDGDGIITVAGDFQAGVNNGIAKLNEDGTINNSFNSEGLLLTEQQVNTALITSKNQIIISGYDFSNNQGFAYRIDQSGIKDNSFGSGLNIPFYSIKNIIETGNYLIMGGSDNSGGIANRTVPLFYSDTNGENVNSDGFGISNANGFTNCFEITQINENELIIGGKFDLINGFNHRNISRININGTVDPHFKFTIEDDVKKIVSVSDSTVLVTGKFGIIKIKTTNTRPEIVGSFKDFQTLEDVPLVISASELEILDDDDLTPDDFELILLEGENYTVTDGKILPATNYYGTITAQVQAFDGKENSESQNIQIEVLPVNDAPIITSLSSEFPPIEGTSLIITLEDLAITDPDNTLPDDFTLNVGNGDNYTVSNNIVIPDNTFTGTLAIPLTVNDGMEDSPIFTATVEAVAVITGISEINAVNISVFPNPSSHYLNINISNGSFGPIKVQVLDFTGKTVSTSNFNKSQFDFSETIELGEISAGAYFLKIKMPDSDSAVRIVVE